MTKDIGIRRRTTCQNVLNRPMYIFSQVQLFLWKIYSNKQPKWNTQYLQSVSVKWIYLALIFLRILIILLSNLSFFQTKWAAYKDSVFEIMKQSSCSAEAILEILKALLKYIFELYAQFRRSFGFYLFLRFYPKNRIFEEVCWYYVCLIVF